MQCPYCEHPDTKVTDSRPSAGGGIRRRRVCERCSQRFTTYEHVDLQLPAVEKRSKVVEAFDREKLVRALKRVAKGRPISAARIADLSREIEAELSRQKDTKVQSMKIAELVLGRLADIDQVARERFAANYRRDDGTLVFDGKVPEKRQLTMFETARAK